MAIRNTLLDLQNMIFEQIEVLMSADRTEIDMEIRRSKAMAALADVGIQNANTMISAARLKPDFEEGMGRTIRVLGVANDEVD